VRNRQGDIDIGMAMVAKELMNDSIVTEPDDDVIAVHEAGHLIVGVLVGRRALKVSIDRIGSKRGCFWDPESGPDWDDFSEMRCLIAGPRAQITLKPKSVPAERRPLFRDRIIQPSETLWSIPQGVYDFTGWDNDVLPVHDYLRTPHAPADEGWPPCPSHLQVVDRAEEVLLRFFSDTAVQVGTRRVAEALLKARLTQGAEAENLVNGQDVNFANDLLAWR